MLDCVIWCYATLCCAVLMNTLCRAVLCCAVLCCTWLGWAVLRCAALGWAGLGCVLVTQWLDSFHSLDVKHTSYAHTLSQRQL